jgi:4'-phosphopantetheinyl transferase
LRLFLAKATGGGPARLRFAYGEHGKPSLERASAPELAGTPLTFNMSHSHGHALYALARGREVGVDIELVRPRRTERLARRFFCPAESEWLLRLPEERRRDAFYALWCAKEAFQKACGRGLSLGLSSFCFALGEQGPTALAWQQGEPAAAGRWSVERLAPAAGFEAALVSAGVPGRLRLHGWCG